MKKVSLCLVILVGIVFLNSQLATASKSRINDKSLMKGAIKSGWTPLHHAVGKNRPDKALEVAKLLIANGADVNARAGGFRETALHRASKRGLVDVVKLLLEKGANAKLANKGGWTPLHHAVGKNRPDKALEVAKLLIANGVDVNARAGGFRETALHRASKRGLVDVVKLLLEKGAIQTQNPDSN